MLLSCIVQYFILVLPSGVALCNALLLHDTCVFPGLAFWCRHGPVPIGHERLQPRLDTGVEYKTFPQSFVHSQSTHNSLEGEYQTRCVRGVCTVRILGLCRRPFHLI